MRLLGCLLFFGGILGSYAGTIRNPQTNECAEGLEGHEYRMSKCDAGSPSQAWVLDGEFIKNKKSRTCLTSLRDGSLKLFACSKTQDVYKRSITNIIIEGTDIKNAYNGCLHFGGQRLVFISFYLKPARTPKMVFE
jgi:hypothetical protein